MLEVVAIRLHHGYIGLLLLVWCALTINGIAVIGEFNIYVWAAGLVIGLILFFHDLYCHLADRRRR